MISKETVEIPRVIAIELAPIVARRLEEIREKLRRGDRLTAYDSLDLAAVQRFDLWYADSAG